MIPVHATMRELAEAIEGGDPMQIAVRTLKEAEYRMGRADWDRLCVCHGHEAIRSLLADLREMGAAVDAVGGVR